QAPRVGRGRSGSAARAMGDRQREGGAAPRAVVGTQDELRRTTAHRHELDAGGIVEPECSRRRAFRRDPAGAPVGAPLGPWQGGACLPRWVALPEGGGGPIHLSVYGMVCHCSSWGYLLLS